MMLLLSMLSCPRECESLVGGGCGPGVTGFHATSCRVTGWLLVIGRRAVGGGPGVTGFQATSCSPPAGPELGWLGAGVESPWWLLW